MKKKIELEFHRLDECPRCKELQLEIYDYWNNPMGYKSIADLYIRQLPVPEGFLNKRELYTFRCKRCGICFPIIWDGTYPMPDLSPIDMRIFMNAFKEGKRGAT